jgi:hypothetical protein
MQAISRQSKAKIAKNSDIAKPDYGVFKIDKP